jgi:cobyrinic acid a,c-diamide synthase
LVGRFIEGTSGLVGGVDATVWASDSSSDLVDAEEGEVVDVVDMVDMSDTFRGKISGAL